MKLDVEALSEPWRDELAELFEGLKAQTQVSPGSSPWEQRRRRIAWPITHAVLPKELHGQLLTAMLHANVAARRPWPETLRRLQDQARGDGKARLRALLSRPVIEDIVLALREDRVDGLGLSPALLKRIMHDLYATPGPRDLWERVLVRDNRARRSCPLPAVEPKERIVCPLVLRIVGGRPSALSLRLPTSDVSASEAPSARLWPLGARRPVSARDVFYGGDMAIEGVDLRALLGEERPVFDDGALTNVPREVHRAQLRRLWASFASPLVFGEHVGRQGEALQLIGETLSPYHPLWVLQPEPYRELPEGVEPRGELYGLHAARVRPGESGRAWLNTVHRERFARQAKARRLGAPTFGGPEAWEDGGVLTGELVALEVTREPVDLNGARVDPGLWRLGAQPSLLDGRLLRTRRGTTPPERPRSITIKLTHDAVEAAPLHEAPPRLRLTSSWPLVGLRVWLRVTDEAGRALAQAETAPLGALPAEVPKEDPVWRRLSGELGARGLEGLTLRASLGAVAADSCALSPAVARAGARWWRSQTPLREQDDEPKDDIRLKVSPGAQSEVILPKEEAAARGALAAAIRVRRKIEGQRPDVGWLRRALDARARWAAARVGTPLAREAQERVQRAIDEALVETLCGADWAEQERRRPPTDVTTQSLAGALVNARPPRAQLESALEGLFPALDDLPLSMPLDERITARVTSALSSAGVQGATRPPKLDEQAILDVLRERRDAQRRPLRALVSKAGWSGDSLMPIRIDVPMDELYDALRPLDLSDALVHLWLPDAPTPDDDTLQSALDSTPLSRLSRLIALRRLDGARWAAPTDG
ncbi:hypothetical protein L6R46_04285 [Myxococcota bacterium]|nr:hypothetical protein [Myxococcota bacterium]